MMQSESTTPSTLSPAQPPGGLFSAADAAKTVPCHPSSVKRVADELRLTVLRTQGGIHLFTAAQVARIRTELERRRREARR